ncbi:MAG: hypothetical protein KAT71_02970, partial [Gammaproteobacteria bacterium]|nr:hypothetical protein [Gammaproteobacteria bacterium]
MSKELLDAILKRDKLAIATLILVGKVDFGIIDEKGHNIIFQAAELGDLETLKLLSKLQGFEAAISQPNKKGFYIIFSLIEPLITFEFGRREPLSADKIQCISFLLSCNPKECLRFHVNDPNSTILHILVRSADFAHRQLLRFFGEFAQKNGLVDVIGREDNCRLTSLGRAMSNGTLLQARYLVQIGVKPSGRDFSFAGTREWNRVKSWVEQYAAKTEFSDTDSEDEKEYEYKISSSQEVNVEQQYIDIGQLDKYGAGPPKPTHISSTTPAKRVITRSAGVPPDASPKTANQLTGIFAGKKYSFAQHKITGQGAQGRCGFTALGIERDEAVDLLHANSKEAGIREIVAAEIVAAHHEKTLPRTIAETSAYQGLRARLKEAQRAEDDTMRRINDTYQVTGPIDELIRRYQNTKAPQEIEICKQLEPVKRQQKEATEALHAFCQDEPTYNEFVHSYHSSQGQQWLTLLINQEGGLVDAIAKLRGLEVCFWQKTVGNSLRMVHLYGDPNQATQILHTDDTHFDLLEIIIEGDVEGHKVYGKIDEKSKGSQCVDLDPARDTAVSEEEVLALGQDMTNKAKISDEYDHRQKEIALHFRGDHLYTDHFSKNQRKTAIFMTKNPGLFFQPGVFCSAAYELANIQYGFPGNTDDLDEVNRNLQERDVKLMAAAATVFEKITALVQETNVTKCIGDTMKKEFATRLDEFIQVYVNSYDTLKKMMGVDASKKCDGRTSQAAHRRREIFSAMGFTKLPIVSTTEEARWALEYASAFVNWSKQDTGKKKATHQPTLATVLSPDYQQDGHPRHPYLGLVYVTKHNSQDLQEPRSFYIPSLFEGKRIQTKCASPGGQATGGYVRARERAFISSIEKEHIAFVVTLRVPNFY